MIARVSLDLSRLVAEVTARIDGYWRWAGDTTWEATPGDRPDEIILVRLTQDGAVDWPPEGQSPGSAALWDHLAATPAPRHHRGGSVTAIEVRDDADGTDSLIEAIIRKLDREDVYLRGEEWRAAIDSPYALTLRQWADSGERDEPTGPRVRVTFTIHIEDITEEGEA